MEYLGKYVFEDTDIRTLAKDDEIWFVGKDVAIALGHKNPERAIREYVDDEDKGVTDTVTPGGKQQVVIINEPGVYSLIFASQTEGAKRFTRWVTHDVIPSIRKRGYYAVPTVQDHIDALIAQTEMPRYKVAEQIIGTRVECYRDWTEAKRIDERTRKIRTAKAMGYKHTFSYFGRDRVWAENYWRVRLSNRQKSGHFFKVDNDYYLDDYIVGVIEEVISSV